VCGGTRRQRGNEFGVFGLLGQRVLISHISWFDKLNSLKFVSHCFGPQSTHLMKRGPRTGGLREPQKID
jgi:hypothetical protein